MNRIDEIFQKATGPADFAKDYLAHLTSLLASLDIGAISKAIEAIEKVRQDKKKVIFLGNGGSAATASHFVNDLSVGTRKLENPYRSISLSDNQAVVTAIANDFGYDQLFTRQLSYSLEPGDIILAISASGNSPNIVLACEYARERGNLVIGLVGFDGGRLKELSDICIHAKTAKGEYGPVEDVHMVMDHLICNYLMRTP